MPTEGWVTRTLGQLLALEYGAGLLEAARSGTGFPVYGSSGLVGWHREYLIEGPGIVVGRKGTVGAVVWSEEAFWPIDTAYYVQLRENHDLRWVYWRLSSLPLDRLESSTGVPGLNRNDAYTISIEVPPLPEQRRIAEVLDAADEAIRQTERVIAKLKAVKAGLLHDLLTRGLDEHGHLRDPQAHPEQFKDSPLGRIPREWEFGGVSAFLQQRDGIKPGPFGSSITKSMYTSEGYRVYGQEQVIAGDLSVGDYYISESKYWELQSFAVQEGDLLISLVGTIGKVLVVRSPFEPGVINPRLIRLRPNPTEGDAEFLKHLLVSPLVHDQLARMAQGGTMPVLSGIVLKRLTLAKPPLKEQGRIAVILDAHDARIRAEEAALAKLRQVKRGLMDDLLTGRVRVETSF